MKPFLSFSPTLFFLPPLTMHGSHFNLSLANVGQDENGDAHHDLNLDLSLSLPLPPPLPTPNLAGPPSSSPSPPSPTPNHTLELFPSPLNDMSPNPPDPTPKSRSPPSPPANPVVPTRWRTRLLKQGKSETIPEPYPWAMNRRATIRSMRRMVEDRMLKIVGKMKCRKCREESEIEYDLVEKFREVERFIANNKSKMHDRAPDVWYAPKPLDCKSCGRESCVRAVIGKKRDINWLFLFLGQMVGFCSIEQLKYYLRHTRNHQTGARNRLLYTVYLSLYNQLTPNGHSHP